MRGTLTEIMDHLAEWFGNEPAVLNVERPPMARANLAPVDPVCFRVAERYIEGGVSICAQERGGVATHLTARMTVGDDVTEVAACSLDHLGHRANTATNEYRVNTLIGFKVRAFEAAMAAAGTRPELQPQPAKVVQVPDAQDGDSAFRSALLETMRAELSAR